METSIPDAWLSFERSLIELCVGPLVTQNHHLSNFTEDGGVARNPRLHSFLDSCDALRLSKTGCLTGSLKEMMSLSVGEVAAQQEMCLGRSVILSIAFKACPSPPETHVGKSQ